MRVRDLLNEAFKLQLERDGDLYVLHILDTKTYKRTEVRGKSGYESGNYDASDELHKLLDIIGKSANVSELINGEVVTINPKHPDANRAQAATDHAFNEDVSPREQKQLEKKLKTLEKALRSMPYSDRRYDKTEAMIVQIKQKLGIKDAKPEPKPQPQPRPQRDFAAGNPINSDSNINNFAEGDIVTFSLYNSDETLTGLVEKITFSIRDRKHGLWIRVPNKAAVINNPVFALNNGAQDHYSHINGIYFEGNRYGVFYEDDIQDYKINKIYNNNPKDFYNAVQKHLNIEVEGDWENRPKSSFRENQEAEPQDSDFEAFNARTQNEIARLKAKYPHAKNLLSALLAQATKNDTDGELTDMDQNRRIDSLEDRIKKLEDAKAAKGNKNEDR